MKLPDIDYGGSTPSAPIRIKTQHGASLSDKLHLLKQGVDGYEDILAAQSKFQIERAVTQLEGANQQIETALTESPSIDMNKNVFGQKTMDALNDSKDLSEQDFTVSGDGRFVSTEKVMGLVYDTAISDHFDMVTDGMSEAEKNSVRLRFMQSQNKTQAALAKQVFTLQRDRLKFGFKKVYDDYIEAGDWNGAQRSANEASGSGAWDAAYLYQTVEGGQKKLVTNAAMTDIQSASDEDELSGLEVYIGAHVPLFGADNARTMLNDLDGRRTDMRKQKEFQYKKGQAVAVGMYGKNQLTKQHIVDALESDSMSPENALTMLNKLEESGSKTTGLTDKKTILNLQANIQTIRFSSGGAATVSGRALELKNEVIRKSTGINPLNPSDPLTPITIFGEDATKLIEEITKVEQATLRPKGFDDAVKVIRSVTGTTDLISFGGNKNQQDAFQDYYKGLIDYMDSAGVEAKPVEWAEKNRERYDPAVYRLKGDDRFTKRYPEYNKFSKKTEQTDLSGMKKIKTTLDHEAVKTELYRQWKANKITKEERDRVYYDLVGEYENQGGAEALRSLEDQDSFYKAVGNE